MITPQYNSNYNSLQALGQRRFGGASQINIAYTYAKNLTDDQNDRSNAPMNSYNVRLDRGRATLDRRQIFTANYVYEVPFFGKRHDFVGNALGGWQVSGIVTLQTGLPFSPLGANYDAAGLGNIPAIIAGNRPNTLCDPNANAPHLFEQFFNTACFQLNPTTGVIPGNNVNTGGRGTINGPSTKRVDFSLFKNLHFGETVRLQIRAEAFNIFNHTNFRVIQTSVASAVYGQVTTVRDPRTIQFGAKLSF